MKGKLLILGLFICVTGINLWAQQDKLLTHFMYDKMSINPGETGIDKGICATTLYRNQWDKVNGAPNTGVFNVEANLAERGFPVGVGISFYQDQIGFTRQNSVLLNFSYPLSIDPGVLGIGLGVGIMNFGMAPEWVPPTTLIDNTLPVGFATTQLDMNFGLYFKGNDGYYIGLSSTHLPESVFESDDATAIEFNSARHYYLMGGYEYPELVGPGVIEGNLLLRTDLIKFSADINARYTLKDMQYKPYGGLTFRTSDAIAIMLGARPFPGLVVGYSYDMSINKLSSVSNGSHEILLKYCYYLPPIPITKSRHPRWL